MPQERRPLLLVLEDDPTLRHEIAEMARETGWEVKECWSVEGAQRIAVSHSQEVKLAFVDMMVPDTDADYLKLRTELDERDVFVLSQYDGQREADFSEKHLMAARSELLARDARIQTLVNLEGGMEFLKNASEKIATWRIMVLSSRTPVAHLTIPPIGDLKDRWIGWRPKPVDPEALLLVLREELQQLSITS